jgi:excisionase family DNA binding protein
MALKILVSRKEAAEILGVSLSHFQRHIQPHLRCVYSGHLRLYRPSDLEEWAERQALVPAGRR